jgi:hypothetical protein
VADEIMMAVASALASKVAEAAAGGVRSAWDALVRLVRDRFAHDQVASAALATAQSRPTDQLAVRELGDALERVTASDPGFAEQVRALWSRVSADLSATGGVLNVSTGTISGHLIQARDLHIEGGLHLGAPPDKGHS